MCQAPGFRTQPLHPNFVTIDVSNAAVTRAHGINDRGQIVGSYTDQAGGAARSRRSTCQTLTSPSPPVLVTRGGSLGPTKRRQGSTLPAGFFVIPWAISRTSTFQIRPSQFLWALTTAAKSSEGSDARLRLASRLLPIRSETYRLCPSPLRFSSSARQRQGLG
jgi:hypothetical protein